MVQSVTTPGVSPVIYPAKPAQNTSQPHTAADSAKGAAPALAPNAGQGQPVHQAPRADADKRQAEERAKDRQAQSAPPSTQLSIALDKAANRYVYKGVEQGSQEVRDQWPSEQALKQLALLREMTGKMFDEET
ncbi:MAG: flagellar protein FlaG [Proteobacteria bacterium]|nr:flagellar protein FlaG [Pseudomonadota bacterium]